ncbi:MAG TPA: helicase-associated domain-containing protein [Anaerolineales bacterium]
MPSLAQTLPSNDIGFLRIVASLWGLELASSDPAEAVIELADGLCDAELLEEVVSTLPGDGRAALDALLSENGRMPWVAFSRRFGELREMGAGKRDREQPHLQPNSAAEMLWYRALLAKAFMNGEKGPQEFAFVPDDLFMALDFAGLIPETRPVSAGPVYVAETEIEGSATEGPDLEALEEEPLEPEITAPVKNKTTLVAAAGDSLGRPASPAEKSFPIPAGDWILDDACSFLSAMRMGLNSPSLRLPEPVLRELLIAARLISPTALQPEVVKTFLEAPRDKALGTLREGWQASESFDELRQLPGLVFEGTWTNQPLVTREFILNLLEPLPEGQWWSLLAFVRDIKTRFPDFQRPAGDYDSWFIRRTAGGAYLRGFASWDEVDGALIRYMLSGPLHWLGLLDLAAPEAGMAASAFRAHLETKAPVETGKLTVTSQGKIVVPRLVPRAARYQIARFCDLDDQKDQEYHYRISAGTLKRAREQGLKAEHLLGLLRKNSSAPIPPSFVKALQRWELNGSEARVEHLSVLKVSRPEVLTELRASKAGRFLGEVLGPTTIVIQPGAQSRVIATLAELGILAEGEIKE